MTHVPLVDGFLLYFRLLFGLFILGSLLRNAHIAGIVPLDLHKGSSSGFTPPFYFILFSWSVYATYTTVSDILFFLEDVDPRSPKTLFISGTPITQECCLLSISEYLLSDYKLAPTPLFMFIKFFLFMAASSQISLRLPRHWFQYKSIHFVLLSNL